MGKHECAGTSRSDRLRLRMVRAEKDRRRDSGAAIVSVVSDDLVSVGSVLDGLDFTGWHTIEDLDDLDATAFTGLDDALLDTSGCPVTDSCAGCGSASGLHAVTSAFSKPNGFDVACAILCHACDGRPFLHLLDPEVFDEAFARHVAHQPSPT